jgi:hypothetical protein
MEEDDFARWIGEKFGSANRYYEAAVQAKEVASKKEPEFLDNFRVLAEREILPVFRSVEKLQKPPIAIRIANDGGMAVSLNMHRTYHDGETVILSLSFSADLPKRMVSVRISATPRSFTLGSGEDVHLEQINDGYVQEWVKKMVDR